MTQDLVSLKVDIADGVAEVTLLGPGKGNAMGPDFWRELPIVFGELDRNDDVRAVVLTGSGANFSYGLDLPAMSGDWAGMLGDRALAKPRTDFLGRLRELQHAVTSVAACRKPVIAAVSGWCIGGGVDVIAADLGSLQRLAGVIGEGHLRELAFTGKDIDAARAEKIHLVNDVYPDQEAVLAAARALAADIATNPPLVVQGVKDVLGQQREHDVAAGLRYVGAWNAAFLPSEDLGEAVQSFLERRPPKFKGE